MYLSKRYVICCHYFKLSFFVELEIVNLESARNFESYCSLRRQRFIDKTNSYEKPSVKNKKALETLTNYITVVIKQKLFDLHAFI